MQYLSTRTDIKKLSFDAVVLAGLAPDGGLYLPESLPQFSAAEIQSMRGLSYPELAMRVMLPFMGDGWDEARLKPIIEKSYKKFRHAEIAPLVELEANHHVLELFHGPTLAFKDFALQFLGNLLEDILSRHEKTVTVIGATSGDTGSAAIHGLAGHENINIYILFPHGRVSDVQRRQMTTVASPNVYALAIEGTFDDCQAMVKTMFADRAFNDKHHLVAVNSINWARIMAQIVYYFYAALKLGAPEKAVSFAVPTGNFGDIYAGWLAKHMGLPVEKLIIATNNNDILARCWESGAYDMKPVKQTLSPSMDIQISSNFERLLFGYLGKDGQALMQLMMQLKDTGKMQLSETVLAKLHDEFEAVAVDDEKTLSIIKDVYTKHGYLLDPHTATGIVAAQQCQAKISTPVVTLATAHPAKFPDAVKKAAGKHPDLPEHMQDLFDLPERSSTLPNDIRAVMSFIENNANK